MIRRKYNADGRGGGGATIDPLRDVMAKIIGAIQTEWTLARGYKHRSLWADPAVFTNACKF